MKTFYLSFLYFLFLAGCSSSSQYKDPIPEHETFNITSQIMDETRVINVWTPPQYASGADSLPVLYMLDGGIKEDFPHIANTVSELIKSKKIPPAILVGIENTKRRRDFTGPTEVETDKEVAPVIGGAPIFRSFIREELFDEINKRYRTKDAKGIIGESAAGLFIVETFFLAPGMFDYYIAFDPSIWWNDHYLVRNAETLLSKFPSDEIRFWFAGSNVSDVYPYTRQLDKKLQAANLPNLTWKYADEPDEKHTAIFRATKEKALIWTLNEGKKGQTIRK